MKHIKTGVKPRKSGSQCGKTKLSNTLMAGACSVVVGTGVGVAVLAVISLVAVNLTVPLTLIRPLACMALCAATLAAAFVLGTIQKQNYLLLGLCCGAFYAASLSIAAAISGGAIAVQENFALLGAVMLAGLAGGLINALRLPAGR